MRMTPEMAAKYGITLPKPKRRRARPLEENVHKVCVRWFDIQYPRLKDCLIHIPNELAFSGDPKQRGAFIGKLMRLRAMGVRAGVLDLLLAIPRNGFHGLWIEMKSKRKSMSDDQEKFAALMRQMGFAVEEDVKTFERFEGIIKGYLGNFAGWSSGSSDGS